MRIKISVPTSALQRDLRKAIHTAMQLGAQGVQFDLRSEVTADHFGDSARRQLQTYLSERNLELASGHFPLNRPLAEPERLDQRLAALNSAIALASKLKIRCLTLQPGELPAVESLQRGILQQILSELATQANLHGVTLCLLSGGEPAAELKQVVGQITTGQVMIAADPADWVLQSRPYVSEFRELFGHIGHIEGRDASRGGGREVPFGQGEIDWHELAALLTEMGYTGWINIQRTLGNDRVNDIARGVQFARQLFLVGTP